MLKGYVRYGSYGSYGSYGRGDGVTDLRSRPNAPGVTDLRSRPEASGVTESSTLHPHTHTVFQGGVREFGIPVFKW